MHPVITSPHNPKIRNIQSLEKSRERTRQNVFLVEGIRELSLAVGAGYEVVTVFFCPDIISAEQVIAIVRDTQLIIPVDRSVFAKIAYRESTEGVLAVLSQKEHILDKIQLGTDPLILILEGVEKPGNLGAILRTADAANLAAVVICDIKTDFYNPNVIRSSVGCLFTIPTAAGSTAEVISWLTDNKLQILATDLQGSIPYDEVDYTGPTAIVLGTESTGISDRWRAAADARILIPMHGKIDSMNVSNAAAIITFEALRQRKVR
jgi:TrmH family RNA methyltransferase